MGSVIEAYHDPRIYHRVTDDRFSGRYREKGRTGEYFVFWFQVSGLYEEDQTVYSLHLLVPIK